MANVKRTRLQTLKEEFLQTTDTLWNTEVRANLYVARIMLITAGMAMVFLLLSQFGVFTINSRTMLSILAQAIMELLIPSIICLLLKGEKKWLKTLLMAFYTLVLARLQMVLGHNVTLCLVFPVVLSVRYYSGWLTSFVTILTILFS
ncbi:MAG: hypothetical protein J5959_17180, partial [Butyrivibrio sp.]|nr:hypothetical protein [Butyrivibrio sp.]